MGCCCSNIDYRSGTCSGYNHDENDIVHVGELDGYKFNKYYFDIRRELLLIKENGYIIDGYIYYYGFRCPSIYWLTNDKGQRILYEMNTFKERMKNKYHDEMRNKIREEIKNEKEGSKDLLLN